MRNGSLFACEWYNTLYTMGIITTSEREAPARVVGTEADTFVLWTRGAALDLPAKPAVVEEPVIRREGLFPLEPVAPLVHVRRGLWQKFKGESKDSRAHFPRYAQNPFGSEHGWNEYPIKEPWQQVGRLNLREDTVEEERAAYRQARGDFFPVDPERAVRTTLPLLQVRSSVDHVPAPSEPVIRGYKSIDILNGRGNGRIHWLDAVLDDLGTVSEASVFPESAVVEEIPAATIGEPVDGVNSNTSRQELCDVAWEAADEELDAWVGLGEDTLLGKIGRAVQEAKEAGADTNPWLRGEVVDTLVGEAPDKEIEEATGLREFVLEYLTEPEAVIPGEGENAADRETARIQLIPAFSEPLLRVQRLLQARAALPLEEVEAHPKGKREPVAEDIRLKEERREAREAEAMELEKIYLAVLDEMRQSLHGSLQRSIQAGKEEFYFEGERSEEIAQEASRVLEKIESRTSAAAHEEKLRNKLGIGSEEPVSVDAGFVMLVYAIAEAVSRRRAEAESEPDKKQKARLRREATMLEKERKAIEDAQLSDEERKSIAQLDTNDKLLLYHYEDALSFVKVASGKKQLIRSGRLVLGDGTAVMDRPPVEGHLGLLNSDILELDLLPERTLDQDEYLQQRKHCRDMLARHSQDTVVIKINSRTGGEEVRVYGRKVSHPVLIESEVAQLQESGLFDLSEFSQLADDTLAMRRGLMLPAKPRKTSTKAAA